MPLLTELEKGSAGRRFYKHSAPNGAFADGGNMARQNLGACSEAPEHVRKGVLPSPFALRPSFTLVEVLLALAICAIVLAAINAVFATAVRLRDRTSAHVDQSIPANLAFEKMRLDLKSVVGPFGFLAGDFKCGAQTMGTTMGLSSSAGGGLDFFASSGVISDNAPWGDIQEVYYQLTPPTDKSKSLGLDLVRCVNRNLLATTTVPPDTQLLMTDVESVDFECFDGTQWRNTWDTSAGDTNLPTAVRIRIQPAVDRSISASKPEALELIVPLITQTRTTNSLQGASSAQGTSSGP
jgi:prepilin-type N-terminal cleavage/methylation domain-containing protein